MLRIFSLCILCAVTVLARAESVPDVSGLAAMSARFAPVQIEVDLSVLPRNERAALADMVRAAHLIDALFMRQVSAGNAATLLALSADPSPLARARLD